MRYVYKKMGSSPTLIIFLSFLRGDSMRTRCYDGKKWQYEFKYEGKRYRKKGFRTKREANSAGLDKLNELKQGIEFEPSLTLYDYFKTWCETCLLYTSPSPRDS